MQFRLRTLLFIMLIVGCVTGYYGNRISQLRREKSAFSAVDFDEYKVTAKGRIFDLEDQELSLTYWLDWPVRKCLGGSGRCQSLQIYVDTSSPKSSLQWLSELQELESLRFRFYSGIRTQADIGNEQMKHLRGLKNLRELHIHGCGVYAEGLRHLKHLPLTILVCGQDGWTQEELVVISEISTLEKLVLSCELRSLSPLKNLSKLKELRFWTDKEMDLSSLPELDSLQTLNIRGFVSDTQLSAIVQCPNLRTIDFGFSGIGEKQIDRLLEMPRLERVDFEYQRISRASFKKLVDAGIEVGHRGLNDYQLESDFLRFEIIDFKLDKADSEIVCVLNGDDGTVGWGIHCETKDEYAPTIHRCPQFISQRFGKNCDWRELSAEELILPVPAYPAEPRLKFDIDHPIYENVVSISDRRQNTFDVRWYFVSFESESGSGEVVARLPLNRVFVEFENPVSRTRAWRKLCEQFRADDFAESKSLLLKRRHEFVLNQNLN